MTVPLDRNRAAQAFAASCLTEETRAADEGVLALLYVTPDGRVAWVTATLRPDALGMSLDDLVQRYAIPMFDQVRQVGAEPVGSPDAQR